MGPVAPSSSGDGLPADASRAPESYFWPLLTLVLVIVPQVLVPARYRLGPPSVVPLVEAVAVVALLAVAARRGPVPRSARPLVLTLFGFLVVANTLAAARLVVVVVRGRTDAGAPPTVTQLLVAAGIALATNVVTFGLLYWQLDGGGPRGRIEVPAAYPDFQFPQTATAGLAAPGWTPRFPDHMYVSFTNVVAFSPTDTMPLTVRTKWLMALQSAISLSVLGVVLARVINALPS